MLHCMSILFRFRQYKNIYKRTRARYACVNTRISDYLDWDLAIIYTTNLHIFVVKDRHNSEGY
jgi:hypothetical protein